MINVVLNTGLLPGIFLYWTRARGAVQKGVNGEWGGGTAPMEAGYMRILYWLIFYKLCIIMIKQSSIRKYLQRIFSICKIWIGIWIGGIKDPGKKFLIPWISYCCRGIWHSCKKNVSGGLMRKYGAVIVIAGIIKKFYTVECKAGKIFYPNHYSIRFIFFATCKCNYKNENKNIFHVRYFTGWHGIKKNRCMLPKK